MAGAGGTRTLAPAMKKITASVGLKGVNHKDDVRVVQQLLNLVPHEKGGPPVDLEADGICGRRTNGAIEKVQAKAWGWRKVTARVEPDGPTLALLNAYAPEPAQVEPARIGLPALPELPPVPPAPRVLSSTFLVLVNAQRRGEQLQDHGFHVDINDSVNHRRAIYFWVPTGRSVSLVDPNSVKRWIGEGGLVTTPQPLGAEDRAGECGYHGIVRGRSFLSNLMIRPSALPGVLIQARIPVWVVPGKNRGAIAPMKSGDLHLVVPGRLVLVARPAS